MGDLGYVVRVVRACLGVRVQERSESMTSFFSSAGSGGVDAGTASWEGPWLEKARRYR